MELIGNGIRGIGPIGINLVQESLTRHILADMLDDEYDKNHDLFDLKHMKIEALILQKNTMEIISSGFPGPSTDQPPCQDLWLVIPEKVCA